MIDKAIHYPVTTAVGVILATLFGALALFQIPIQLIPTVDKPVITVTTFWPGASPAEVERELVNRQEKFLKSLPGLEKMKSNSADSQAQITLELETGTDLDAMFVQVGNKLDQVTQIPRDAEKPIITGVDANASAMVWMTLGPADPESWTGDIAAEQTFVENTVAPVIERVAGVAQVNMFGGREKEIQVLADPEKMAAMGVTYNRLATALEAENRNYSAGDFNEGKRRYVVRTVGEYGSVEDVEDVVIAVRDGVPIYVRDIGEARLGHEKVGAIVTNKGVQIIAMAVIRQAGANVIDTMSGIREAVDGLERDVLGPRGLSLTPVYEETAYIDSAIDLVQQSLMLGGVLAVLVLLLFLRSGRSTLVVAVAIPISAITTFLMMRIFGRTINVVSLAGMAFAVGMVVDNSIVVLENIYRHLQMGKKGPQAARDGAGEVWGAVLASTLTTIAVFLPIFFVEEEAGQLFRDIALAISCAVALSLLVAITVIPAFSARILRPGEGKTSKAMRGMLGLLPLASRYSRAVTRAVHWTCGGRSREIGMVAVFVVGAVLLIYFLIPKAEYLPTGNQNFLFGIVLPPPGYSVEETKAMGKIYDASLRPLWEADDVAAAKMPGGGLRDFFFVATNGTCFMGASARDPMRTRELLGAFYGVNAQIPGAIAFTFQQSIFQTDMGGGRVIDVELTGPELLTLIGLGQRVFGQAMQLIPGAQIQPIPSLDLGNPEIRVRTDRRRAAELGITNRDLGFAVNAMVDGVKATEYRFEGLDIDLSITSPDDIGHRTHELSQLPIAAPNGEIVTLSSLADISQESGPVSIEHRERQRAIIIQIQPPEDVALGEAMSLIERQIVEPLYADGTLGGVYNARLSGTADKLTQTGKALQWNFLLAIVITYLLLAALFESFLYPFVILFSVPLAALGGLLGLWALGFESIDVLTMLGFIILVGTVVNNAILIVHQSLIHLRRDGMTIRDAITDATQTRIRPIFMSVSTSVFGMLPLVLFPGAGSELYRGLGSVVVGGLIVSTVFTLFLVPALLSLMLRLRGRLIEDP